MRYLWLALLIIMFRVTCVTVDDVDLAEHNRVVCEDGRVAFEQMIWYDFRGCEYVVVDWRLVNSATNFYVLPEHRTCPWRYRLWFFDDGRLRLVRAKQWRNSWTTDDPEINQRETYPQESRRKLTQ